MRWLFLVILIALFAIPIAYASECCNSKLETVSCNEKGIIHDGKCTGDEAFLLEYDPIVKRYVFLKSFQNGNEAFEVNSVKMLIRTGGNITLLSSNNERIMLDLNSKQAYFNEMAINNSGFLTRYGVRVYPSGKAELPKKKYEAFIDIYAQNNKTSVQLTPGNKVDVTLSHSDLETLKDSTFKHNNNSYNAREILTLKNIYLDSGSFFASKPEPFIEAERMTYLLHFVDDIGWGPVNSTSPFKFSFLGKDASIYELDPPHKVLLSLDGKINFRTDNGAYDNVWTWTVTSVPKLFLGLNAASIRQGESCIETPFGYVKICPRKINASELTYLGFAKINATFNNMTATLIEVNSSELFYGSSSRQLLKMFIADAYAYRTLVVRAEPKLIEDVNETVAVKNEPEKAAEKVFEMPSLEKVKFGLYVIFALLILLLIFAFIKLRNEPSSEE